MKSIIDFLNFLIKFLISLNGVFAPKSPLDHPVFSDMYSSIMDISSVNSRVIKKSIRNDMAAFGSDFKKATGMAKEMLNVK